MKILHWTAGDYDGWRMQKGKNLTNRVDAEKGKLTGKASVLKAQWPESLIKWLPMLLASLGKETLSSYHSRYLGCCCLCRPSIKGLNTEPRLMWQKGLIIAASLLICSFPSGNQILCPGESIWWIEFGLHGNRWSTAFSLCLLLDAY